jgi:chromosome segregation ATPase
MDSFFENADLHCFKRGMKSEEFINSINTVCALSAGLKVPVDELPEYINQQNKKADEINEEIERLKMTEMEAFWSHAVSKEKLEEYERKRPELEKLEATQKKLAETKNKNDHFEQQLIACDREIHRLNYEHAIPIDQLMLVNKRLDKPLERQEFSDLSKELHHHLAKYPDVIAIIRERIHLRYAPSADLTGSN